MRSKSRRFRKARLCDDLQPSSCNDTPCEIVERLAERGMHGGRLFRGQYLLSPGLELFGRHAAASSGNIERPAEMLARVAQPDTHAVMRAYLVIERADVGQLLRQRRLGFDGAAIETPPD